MEIQKEEQILHKMEGFVAELEQYLLEGKGLREISQITFDRRESGDDIPYMGLLNRDARTKEFITIVARPTSKQKDLFEWFSKPRKDKKYLLRAIYIENGKVEFYI